MKHRTLCLSFPAGVLFALLCTLPLSATSSRLPSVATEATTIADKAALDVRAFGGTAELEGIYGGAEVFINGLSAGWTRYSSDSVLPGTYQIEVRAKNYYPSSIQITLSPQTRYRLIFTLSPITGTVNIEVSPQNAALTIDGGSVGAGQTELSVGSHELVASLFGFEPQRLNFNIEQERITGLNIELKPAAFSVDRLAVSQTSFNPRNSGRFGGENISFWVSSFGSADLSIINAEGAAVFEKHYDSFDTWEQTAVWQGRTDSGQPCSDGIYTVKLRVWPAGSDPAESAGNLETVFTIDSNLVVGPFESQAGSRGLLYAGDPWPTSMRLFAISIKAEEAADFASAPFVNLGVQYETGALGLGAEGAVEPASSGSKASAALGLRYALSRSTSVFAWAVQLRGLYNSAGGSTGCAAGCETGADSAGFAVEAALPLGIKAGPLRIAVEPGYVQNISAAGELSGCLLLEGGLWLRGSSWEAGISGKMLSGADTPLSPAAPYYAALEGRCFIGPDSFILSGRASTAFVPGGSAAFKFSLGFGLLF